MSGIFVTWRHFSEIWQLQHQTNIPHIHFHLLNFLLMTFADEAKALLLGAGADSHAHHLATFGENVCVNYVYACVCEHFGHMFVYVCMSILGAYVWCVCLCMFVYVCMCV